MAAAGMTEGKLMTAFDAGRNFEGPALVQWAALVC
jgi:hypothetical protein